ncbi:trifunctional transcriptional activator/DNA repair protein Ada/methylated-DNA--[protein]-cysteine S-methyltransferase [Clostridiaceae bacterium M8S5]|nr:trifunctional transcriptional activator/DNA repair protein Ada/methylated-DNA--[protein]-cysteine S-methyltransferase [Clostridiaceae bacterium M8S5]
MVITDKKIIDRYYQMLIDKNPEFEGIFFVGVKTTGIFCRPTCPAKKPKKENCEFFSNAQEALLASYRPCKRCKPLSLPSKLSPDVKKLVEAVEANPEKRWRDSDFDDLAIHPNTARRQFKKQFGMTFIQYSRARRLGIAFKHIRNKEPIISAQIESNYESGNGFRDAFSRIMGKLPSKSKEIKVLYSAWIETRLGSMIAISDDTHLYLLEFVDRRGLENEIMRLRRRLHASILPDRKELINVLEKELTAYFSGKLKHFTVPICLIGSDFQKCVWNELMKIPVGETTSYKELAIKMEKPSAYRAVANANGANQLALIIPCHRVINSGGGLGGYGGGIARKEWLLKHEQSMVSLTTESFPKG